MSAPALARSLDPSTRQVWRSLRGPVVVALSVLLTALVLAAVGGGGRTGLLDPRAVDPAGSRALAEVLRDQGVQVELVTTNAGLRDVAGAADTVLVAFPERLLPEQAATVRDTGADLVVVGTQHPEQFAHGVLAGAPTMPQTRQPACALPAAERAGSADTGGLAYEAAPESAAGQVDGCYASGGQASVLQVRDAGRSITFLGNPRALTNDRLGKVGNAALALGLLGPNPRLLWYLPSLGDTPPGGARSFYALVPDGVWWGLGQVAVAVLLLGLPRRAEPPEVVDAVAARTRRTGPEIAALLYGAAPADDAALVRLAHDLDALDREIRRP